MSVFRRFFEDLRIRCCIYGVLAMLAGCAGPDATHFRSELLQPIATAYRQEVVMTAMGLMGTPYRYGGNDPERGFDCSGLVNYVFRQAADARLPRSSGDQAAASRRIARRDLQQGDLVFFNTLGRANSHVGIYIGGGRFVNAPSSGGRVRIDSMDSPYFSKRFDSARSLFASR